MAKNTQRKALHVTISQETLCQGSQSQRAGNSSSLTAAQETNGHGITMFKSKSDRNVYPEMAGLPRARGAQSWSQNSPTCPLVLLDLTTPLLAPPDVPRF